MSTWDPTAPLRPGVTLLEASAGTGKTYGIASLVLRLVAEEAVPIHRILVVTYTRAATAELEHRVRQRLSGARAHLAGLAAEAPDEVVSALLARSADEQRLALRRLNAAILGFDQAVITTIHGFCQRMLQRNAFESGVAFDLALVPDTDALVHELVDDFLVRTFYAATPEEITTLRERCGFTRDGLRLLARRALADPDVAVTPSAADPSPAGRRAQFVAEIRETFEVRKSDRRVQTYQDLLRGLARRLAPDADPAGRAALIAAIGSRFDAALIDEFQDTDAQQWTLFSTCFGSGDHHLWLIGDPKQAIYGFRGANVQVYAAAAESAGSRRFTLTTNWRSDARLLGALNGLMNRPAFFGPGSPFAYIPVAACERNQADRLRGGGGALQLRWIDPALVGEDAKKPLNRGPVGAALPTRVAADVVALLDGDARLADGDTWRPVRAGDIAVLVRTGLQATRIQAALTAVGVPAVLTGSASVLASDEALAVQQWLHALASSGGGSASRVAASNGLFGWTANDLVALESGELAAVAAWEHWLGDVARWRNRFLTDGFTPAFGAALDDAGILPRLLGYADGERRATNLLHVAELLDTAEREQRLGLGALIGWLERRRADEELDADEIELRLDRDADAVRVLTIHKSKGLEFPVTFVPFLWDGSLLRPSDSGALLAGDVADPTRRILDVTLGGKKSGPADTRARAEQEAREEGLRLAYVALTRARVRCVVYTGFLRDFATCPLAPTLHGSGPDRFAAAAARFKAGAAALRADLEALAAAVPGLTVTEAGPPTTAARERPAPSPAKLAVRTFLRGPLDTLWRRHSYTSMVRAAGEAPEMPDRVGFDADAVADDGPAPRAAPDAEVPLGAFPSGAEAGTLLHAILEKADFERPEELSPQIAEALAAFGFEPHWEPLLAAGLAAVLRTPLGGPLGALRLCDLSRASRLDELRFDLPLREDTPVRGDAIATALRGSRLPSAWLSSLDRLDPLRFAGFLTGSIDLVFRAPDRRWFVVDYKSNRLTTTRGCVPEAFADEPMRRELARHDYYLQYHLYVVALHRYLRWRLGASYQYDRDMGGVYYLFLRGLIGPAAADVGDAVAGSFFDRPARDVIEALDAALGGV